MAAWSRRRLAPVCRLRPRLLVPKSVSLLHALGDDRRVRREVSEAHDAAWQAALALPRARGVRRRARARRRDARARRGVRRGGVPAPHEPGAGSASAHARDRRQHGAHPCDGKWRALDGEAILRTYRLAAGYLYEAQLRARAHDAARRRVARAGEGDGRARGVSRAGVLRAFSTTPAAGRSSTWRRRRRAATPPRRVAALATREREGAGRPAAAARGVAGAGGRARPRPSASSPSCSAGPPRREPSPGRAARELAHRLLGPAGLTEKQTAFTEPELVMAWARGRTAGARRRAGCAASATRFSALAASSWSAPGEPGRPARFTTARADRRSSRPRSSSSSAAATSARPPRTRRRSRGVCRVGRSTLLAASSAMLVHEAATRPTGSSASSAPPARARRPRSRALADAFRASGVAGARRRASGRAADELADGDRHPRAAPCTGSSSTPTERRPAARLRARRRRGRDGRDAQCSRRCSTSSSSAEGKAVLVGDPQQLPAVGAGGLFAALFERLGAIELTENRRQHDDARTAGARRDPRRRRPRATSPTPTRSGRLTRRRPDRRQARLLADWWQRAQHDLAGNVMLAYRRGDVADLNDAAHTLLDSNGRLGRDALAIGGREFRVGDRVVCRRNNDRARRPQRHPRHRPPIDTASRRSRLATDARRPDRAPRPLPRRRAPPPRLRAHRPRHPGRHRRARLRPRRGEGALQEWGYVASPAPAPKPASTSPPHPNIERASHAPTVQAPEPLTRLAQALEESQARTARDRPGPTRARAPPRNRPATLTGHPRRDRRERLRLLERERFALQKTGTNTEHVIERIEHEQTGTGPLSRGKRAALAAELDVRPAEHSAAPTTASERTFANDKTLARQRNHSRSRRSHPDGPGTRTRAVALARTRSLKFTRDGIVPIEPARNGSQSGTPTVEALLTIEREMEQGKQGTQRTTKTQPSREPQAGA